MRAHGSVSRIINPELKWIWPKIKPRPLLATCSCMFATWPVFAEGGAGQWMEDLFSALCATRDT